MKSEQRGCLGDRGQVKADFKEPVYTKAWEESAPQERQARVVPNPSGRAGSQAGGPQHLGGPVQGRVCHVLSVGTHPSAPEKNPPGSCHPASSHHACTYSSRHSWRTRVQGGGRVEGPSRPGCKGHLCRQGPLPSAPMSSTGRKQPVLRPPLEPCAAWGTHRCGAHTRPSYQALGMKGCGPPTAGSASSHSQRALPIPSSPA